MANSMCRLRFSGLSGVGLWMGLILSFVAVRAPSLLADATPGLTKIGTVDLEKAFESVSQGKNVKKQLESNFEKTKADLQKEEAAIKKAYEEYTKQSAVLTNEAKAKKQQEIQGRYVKFQEAAQKSDMDFQRKKQELMNPVFEKMREIISQLAQKKGYTVILEKNNNSVLYSQDQDDLTSEVIKTFDEKHKG